VSERRPGAAVDSSPAALRRAQTAAAAAASAAVAATAAVLEPSIAAGSDWQGGRARRLPANFRLPPAARAEMSLFQRCFCCYDERRALQPSVSHHWRTVDIRRFFHA